MNQFGENFIWLGLYIGISAPFKTTFDPRTCNLGKPILYYFVCDKSQQTTTCVFNVLSLYEKVLQTLLYLAKGHLLHNFHFLAHYFFLSLFTFFLSMGLKYARPKVAVFISLSINISQLDNLIL